MRLRQFIVLVGPVGVSACGDGIPPLETVILADEFVGIELIEPAAGQLSSVIESNGFAFPGVPSLVEDPTTTIHIATDYTVTISTDAGVLASFADSDQIPSIARGIKTYSTNSGADGLVFNKPVTSMDPSTFSLGLDYVAFGVWLSGAVVDFATATSEYEVEDAGVLVVGAITPPAGMPISGTATYAGDAVAILADCLIVDDILNGAFTSNVDFGLGQVTTTIALDHSNGDPWGTINSTSGVISPGSHQFEDLSVTSNQGMDGHIHGFFAGPSAEEIAAQFHLGEPDTEKRVIGSFGGVDLAGPM